MHANYEKVINIPQDLDFLQDQRGARKMSMGCIDKVFMARENKRRKRKMEEEQRMEKHRRLNEISAHMVASDSSGNSSCCEKLEDDDEWKYQGATNSSSL